MKYSVEIYSIIKYTLEKVRFLLRTFNDLNQTIYILDSDLVWRMQIMIIKS